MTALWASTRRIFALLAMFTLLPPIGAWFGALWWPLELLAHFHGCYALGLAATAALLVCIGYRRVALAVAAMSLLDASFVLPLWFGGDDPVPGRVPLKVVCANIATHNRDHDSIFELIDEQQPDVVALIEVDSVWLAAASRRLAATHPHHLAEARIDNFGIAFWSRLPCTKLEVHRLDRTGVPSIEARIETADGPCTVFVTHPIPPTLSRAPTARDEHLRNLATFAASHEGPLAVVGDLNTSSWTGSFGDLLRAGRLRDGRHGFGLQPTWPGRLARIGIAIDHVLVNDGLSVQSHQVGPYVGSDHRPLIVALCVRG